MAFVWVTAIIAIAALLALVLQQRAERRAGYVHSDAQRIAGQMAGVLELIMEWDREAANPLPTNLLKRVQEVTRNYYMEVQK